MGRPRLGSCVVDSIKLVSQLTETARPNERRGGRARGPGMKGDEEVRFRACLC